MIERTLSIIKPDATRRNVTGQIITIFENAGFKIVEQKRIKLTRSQAEDFYAEHKAKPFFDGLCSFMSSGPVIVQVLEAEDAIAKNRKLMGNTDYQKAELGTIRFQFAESITANTVHGSDSKESAEREIAFFFSDNSSEVKVPNHKYLEDDEDSSENEEEFIWDGLD